MSEHALQRVVELVGDSGDQLSQRRQLLRLSEAASQFGAFGLETGARRHVTRDKDEPEHFLKAPIIMRVGEFTPEPISVARYLSRSAFRLKDDWLTFDELRARRRELELQPLAPPDKRKEQARERTKFAIIYHDKINLSLAVFSFALIGVPLGIKVSRRETSANLGLALLLVLGYYLMTVVIKWLDRHPEYHPDLLLWLPNVIFIALGVWLFRRIDRK